MNNKESLSGFKLDKPFSKYFDHTLLKPEASRYDIGRLVTEAVEWDFASVCVNGCYVKTASDILAALRPEDDPDSIGITAVVGFPLGACTTETKVFEARTAMEGGASEIDMVINIGAAREGSWDYVESEIRQLAGLCHGHGTGSPSPAVIKVILETCLLSDEEIVKVCRICRETGVDFVKTSTGFSTSGATAEHVSLMKKAAGLSVKVKASGGIRTLSDALAMIEAGADRLGCSSSAAILKEYSETESL